MPAPVLIFDVECYSNFFLLLMKRLPDGLVRRFQISPSQSIDRNALHSVLRSHLLVGFNSNDYDMPMIQLAMSGASTRELKEASDRIIVGGMQARDFRDHYGLSQHGYNHIDLIQVAPLKASLKIYGGRLHVKKLQDLPISPDAVITPETARELVPYCCNDLEITEALWNELSSQISLRETLSAEYQHDLRSRSDAQVAEAIIAAEIQKLSGQRPKRPAIEEGRAYKYRVPDFIQFRTPALQELLERIRNADFRVNAKGSIELPGELDKNPDVKVNGRKYRIGIGGLHSQETRVCHVADEGTLLIDRDVTSYYPSIILNQGLYPQHLGVDFLTVYRTLVDRRVAAKKAGDKVTAESLKIAINGTFGKLGNKYSAVYSPDLLIQVTVTGQLVLLMLIEMCERNFIPVISANTDGILIKCATAMHPKLLDVIAQWEKVTGFGTEETRYRAVYAKDVNNYLAIKLDGSVKGKGLYANPWEKEGPNIFKLHKNPQTTIVIEAVVAHLRDGVALEKTIRECRDVRKFISVRAVNGGAHIDGAYIGKAVRWFYSSEGLDTTFNYRKTGNKVPKSDGAKPLMELPDAVPADLNYDWYISEAKDVLVNIGVNVKPVFGAGVKRRLSVKPAPGKHGQGSMFEAAA